MKGRILALSNAHDQVVRSDGGGLLSALIFAEIGPYRATSREIEIRGPELALNLRAFSVLALVLHELTTNAAKYGSLSNDTGRLEISWSLEANGDCRLRWREVGGPPVKPPARSGFGAALIRRSVPFDLGGEAEVRFLTDGVEVDLLVPASYVENRPGGRKPPVAPQPAPDRAERALAGKRVLLVEDQFVIALEAEGILRDSGAGKVDLAATASEAARAISAAKPDLAVLDVNLGATTSLPIADRLADLGVPFVFATGYGDGSTISDRHRGAPVSPKTLWTRGAHRRDRLGIESLTTGLQRHRLGEDFIRAQPRAMIVDRGGDNQFVGAGSREARAGLRTSPRVPTKA